MARRKVTWAPRVLALLEEAARYVEIDSPSAARRLVSDAFSAADSLSDLSERGREVPELEGAGYRELLVGKYRLLYSLAEERVVIVGFVHGSRDFRAWWTRFRRRSEPN